MRRLPLIFSVLSLSLLLVGATCAPKTPRLKPKKFDLLFRIDPALAGASVQVDIIGASTRSYLPSLESIQLSQYWSPGNPLRRDVPKATIVFGRGSPSEQTFSATDQKWTSWLGAGAEVLVLMLDAPGIQDRLSVPLDQREWGNVQKLEFLIQESGIRLVTARPTK
jgi:hypothetical protein